MVKAKTKSTLFYLRRNNETKNMLHIYIQTNLSRHKLVLYKVPIYL